MRSSCKSVLRLLLLPIAVFLAASFAFSTPVQAAPTVPYKINFQGHLTNVSGSVLSGTYDMQFKLYTALTGGTLVWSETRTAANANAVTVTNGLFSVLIGEGTAFAGSSATLQAGITANTTLYLEVIVGSETLTPRSQFGSSAYAFNADTIDGIDGSLLAQLGGSNTWTAAQTVNIASASAFAVTNGSTNLFKADTSNSQVVIGASDTTAALLVLDTKTSTGDPTAVAGAMYYNSNSGKLRCSQGGTWVDCVSAPTLQNAYDNSSTPATITTSAAGKGIAIAAGTVPTTDLLSISNAGQGVTAAGVNGLSVNYVGGAANVEASGMRVDLTPGGTSGGTWNGLRVVTNATGAGTGVAMNGIKLEGPTAAGAGTESALYVGTGWDIGLDLNSGGLQFGVQTDPSTPAAGELRVYAKVIAGRTMLKALGPSGVDYNYQPSLFQQSVVMVTPGAGTSATTYTALGGSLTVSGTLASASSITDAMGSMSNIATGTTANTGAGFQTVNLQYFRGTGGNNADGFFYAARVNFSGNTAMALANYTNTTTGARFYAGVASINIQGTSSMTASDNPSGSYAGFQFSAVRDTNGNFRYITKDGTNQNVVDTGVALAVSKTFDFYSYCAPGGTTAYWRIDNLTDGTSTEGNTASSLPAAATGMRAGVALAPLSTTAIHYRFQRMYVETDR